ncbi:MAG TPA: EpsG family protein [Sphingopyxis sp.]|nr:EpsG family protein [Sphingopyxis sp.]
MTPSPDAAFARSPALPPRPTTTPIVATLFSLVFALAYANYLTNLPLDAFQDRLNYFVYASSSEAILNRYASSNLSLLSNEPLWIYLNIFLGNFLYRDDIVKTIIFVPAFLTAFLSLRNNSNSLFWVIIMLLVPQVIKNNIIHLRQGVAVAVFLAGYYSDRRILKILLMGMAPLIHSSFFIILMIWGITYATGIIRLSVPLRVIFFTACYAIVAVVLLVVASSLGARQALMYESIDPNVSGFGFAFWSVVLILFLSAGTDFVRRFAFPISILTFYLVTYFAVPFAARVLESGLLIILGAGLALNDERKLLFLTLLTGFTVLSYVERLGQPWLGWGV